MTGQEVAVLVVGAVAVAYLGWRYVIRRRAATCCGESECPAAKATDKRIAGGDPVKAPR